jgi:hypothetical protein
MTNMSALSSFIEFSFYVDKTGRRARNGWIIHWEGVPTFCALSLPYVIAFDPSFIEIRHVETVSCFFSSSGYILLFE